MTTPRAGIISVDRLRELVAAGSVDTVICAVCDMQGRLVGKRVTGAHFVEHCLSHGTHFCTYLLATDMEMNTPDGYATMNWESGFGDYVAQPDWATLRLIPWLDGTALVLADSVHEESGKLVDIAPRSILRRQIERAAAIGFRPIMASELEFYLLTDSYEQAHAKHFVDLQRASWFNEDYQLLQGSKLEPLYRSLRNLLTQAGIPIEFSKGEAGPGQHELNIHYADALESADRHALLKQGAKEIAAQRGFAITFMAKPDHTWTGSSGHVHISLWDASEESNLFWDGNAGDPRAMSPVMHHFLGGLLSCARELSLFVASSVNSYKRYAAASWAPVRILWASDNRTCGFRVVGSERALRIENRFPGGDANPYLAYAAILAAGLHGIEAQIEPPAEFQGNAYLANDAPRVPRSLYEAIDAFWASEVARNAFGTEVVDHYLNMARVEQETYDGVVTTWERARYLERG